MSHVGECEEISGSEDQEHIWKPTYLTAKSEEWLPLVAGNVIAGMFLQGETRAMQCAFLPRARACARPHTQTHTHTHPKPSTFYCVQHQHEFTPQRHIEVLLGGDLARMSFICTWPPCRRAGEGPRSRHRCLLWSRLQTAPAHAQAHNTDISSTAGLNKWGTSKVHTPFQITQILQPFGLKQKTVTNPDFSPSEFWSGWPAKSKLQQKDSSSLKLCDYRKL